MGADALAEAFTSFGMFGLTVEDWAQMLGAAERGEGPPVDWGMFQRQADVLGRVRRASDEELVRARTVLLGLRGFYGLYVMHGLFMPDTPALAALRDRIDECGVGPVLDHVIALNPSPKQLAENLAVCLGPPFDGLYEMLTEQLTADPKIFRLPGNDTGPAAFMETWMRTLRELFSAGCVADKRGRLAVRGVDEVRCCVFLCWADRAFPGAPEARTWQNAQRTVHAARTASPAMPRSAPPQDLQTRQNTTTVTDRAHNRPISNCDCSTSAASGKLPCSRPCEGVRRRRACSAR
ncbi:hypothetical protein ABT218_36810 [Streptomyces sp. NPDC001455]|uniref:hypothetical protein n=1 Tax=Streptomyces sp. NPDC001455 TaxID=3154518 RepID=UPI00333304CF